MTRSLLCIVEFKLVILLFTHSFITPRSYPFIEFYLSIDAPLLLFLLHVIIFTYYL